MAIAFRKMILIKLSALLYDQTYRSSDWAGFEFKGDKSGK
jgi:hypothetical protein